MKKKWFQTCGVRWLCLVFKDEKTMLTQFKKIAGHPDTFQACIHTQRNQTFMFLKKNRGIHQDIIHECYHLIQNIRYKRHMTEEACAIAIEKVYKKVEKFADKSKFA
jgi:hypothetical protein